MRFRPLFAIFLALFAIPAIANAQWVYPGTPISTNVNDQRVITSCPDGAGGAILTWEDYRFTGLADVFAQRVSASGVPQWTTDGVVICSAATNQYQPRIASDGAGGAIITWMDFRSGTYDVYAQRVNASGIVQWTPNGLLVASGTGDQVWPIIAADGAGGALITWYDNRNVATSGQDIYVQRINSLGASMWTANGLLLCNAVNDQTIPQVASDNAGGAFVTWSDLRPGPGNSEIYVQHINFSGTILWGANGTSACIAAGNQDLPMVASDGGTGAVFVWQDFRAANWDIYAQHFLTAGATTWTVNGTAVCTASGNQTNPVLLADGTGGAYFTWSDNRGSSLDIYAQRINGPGVTLWASGGTPVCNTTGAQSNVQIVTDGANGAILTWEDSRVIPSDVYTQHLDGNGTPQWSSNGAQMDNSAFADNAPIPVADGAGNVIVAWSGYPAGIDANIYAQRIDGRYGVPGRPDPVLFAAKDVPNDQGGKVRLEWYASGLDVLNQRQITKYTIWRAIDQAAYAAASAAGVPEVRLTDPASKLTGKAIRRENIQATDYFWELIGEQGAIYRRAYSFSASTSFDSTATNAATHRFQVVAYGADQLYNWPSNILTGRSVDNLAPPAPLFLTATRSGANVDLRWNGVHVKDLDKYTVYRATSTGVTPIPVNFLANDNDTLLTDSNAPGTALYYVVTASDIHQNQGLKSNEAGVAAATGVGGTPSITALTVMQNSPNPFTSETQLQVGLPAKSDVRVEIYDVAGKRVRSVLAPAQPRGWNTLRILARDDRGSSLASGVYFYRVRAGSETVTRKMVITR